ncbi:MAG: hypothetical protein AAGF11_03870 [Myxococcota bacterium]
MSPAPLALALVALVGSESQAPGEPAVPNEPAPPEERSTVEPDEPAIEPEDPMELARQAEEAFAQGRFEAVSDLAARAYALTGDPRHLYAQALAERRLDHCREALILYARVLARVKDDPTYAVLVDGTRQGITLCEEHLEAEQGSSAEGASAGPDPVVMPVEPDPSDNDQPLSPPWYRDVAGGVLLGMGLAIGAGVGGTTWALSSQALRSADRAGDETAYADARSRARTLRTVAIVSFAAGGAQIVGAVIRYVLVDRTYRRQRVGLAPLPGSGLAVHVRGSF